MVIGGTLGAAVGQVFHLWMPGVVSHPSSFAVVGMAGFFAAAAKTPLSTVIMVSEMTGNYELLVPAVWVCSLSFMVSRRWSIYHSQVPSKVHSPAHFNEYAMQIMGATLVGDVYKKDRKFVTIPRGTPAVEVLKVTADTRQRVFPVVDEGERLIGTFHVGELLHLLHDEPEAARQRTAGELVAPADLTVTPSDAVAIAQRLMTSRGVDELVVTQAQAPQSVLGILTSTDVLMAYNRRLAQVEDANHQPELPLDEPMGPTDVASEVRNR
jgi:CIC family chloride channel protein